MATPSPIYRSTESSTDRLYYRPQGSQDLVQIANPQELQNLAKQGAVEVGKAYLPYTPPSASQAPAPSSASAQPSQDPRLKTEVSPGVFSSSKLSSFYDNQIELMRPQFEAAQKALESASSGLGSLKAPDLRGAYDAQYASKIAPLDQAIADSTSKLNALDTNIAALEDAVRSEIGGRASEASIQAEVARRAKPLILQRQSYATEIGSLNDQRSAAISGVEQGITFEQQGFQNQATLFEKQRDLAQSTLDAFSSLVEKGASASNQDVDNFRQTFTTLLSQAPDVLRNLTQDEVSQLQGGYIPYSVMTKIGDTINEQKLAQASASSPKIFGSAQSGYYTLDASGNPKQLIAPATASTGGLTQTQRIQAAVKLMEANPAAYPDIDSAIAAVSSLSGTGQGGPAMGSGRSSVNVGGFDISTYATDPNHEAAVATIVDRIGQFGSVADVDAYIKKVAPGSPITGAMVANASQQFQVPWEIMVAMMQQDSNLGTAGKGAKTFNPGNVGNDDAGNIRNYGSWQSGVNAVADWLSKHRASSTPDYIDQYTRQAQSIMSAAGKDARNAAVREVSDLVRRGDVAGAKRTVESLAYNQMSATDKGSYDENANAIASLSVAAQLANDPTLSVGPYKALFQSKSPYALIQQDPKYAAFKVFTDIGQAQIKRAFFGTAVSANEQETAGGFLVLPTDDMETIKVKLTQLPKVLQFANDAKIAKASGSPAPKLTDYVDVGKLVTKPQASRNVDDALSALGY